MLARGAGLLRALLPRRCPGCGGQLGEAAGLCRACRAGLHAQLQWRSLLSPRAEPHLLALGPYRGLAGRAVRALKYQGARDLAPLLGAALAAGVPPAWRLAAVTAVPMHPAKRARRGYDQAELLGRALADSLDLPYLVLLRRTSDTAAQAQRSAAERHSALSGAFVALPHRPLGPLLLLDDVLTTAATLLACRDALEAAGHGPLKYAVVAR